MSRVGDIVDPAETRGDLIARGYSENDATVAVAFGVWLRRGGNDAEGDDATWARGELSDTEYLDRVAPDELSR